jgi:hypothetical protein
MANPDLLRNDSLANAPGHTNRNFTVITLGCVLNEQARYDGLDSATLVNLLVNPAQRPEVHKAAISALSRRPPRDRTQHLLRVLKVVIDDPKRYDLDVMMATIDVLATDPDSKATEALIEMMPAVLNAGEKNTGLTHEFREYFYQALITRRREDDLEVWREEVPRLKPDTLVAMLYDPAAVPLNSLDPIKLITRLPSSERNQALRKIFFRSVWNDLGLAFSALRMMVNPSRTLKAPSKK